jgi:hypothetical protein
MVEYGRGEVENRLFQSFTIIIIIMIITIIIDITYTQNVDVAGCRLLLKCLDSHKVRQDIYIYIILLLCGCVCIKARKVDRSGFGFTHPLFLTELDEWADKRIDSH